MTGSANCDIDVGWALPTTKLTNDKLTVEF